MKQIKLSGRERAVLRAIDFSTGTLGQDLLEHTRLQPEDLVDILNGLMDVGYAEVVPFSEHTSSRRSRVHLRGKSLLRARAARSDEEVRDVIGDW
jgi:DNA-binding MarR family transcriptional regulator